MATPLTAHDASAKNDDLLYEKLKRPLCPNCYSGEILYNSVQGSFCCNKCGDCVKITTEKDKRIDVTVRK